MQKILHQLIDRYHDATIEAAEKSREIDNRAIKAAAGRGPSKDLASWIIEYGVARVKGLTIDGITKTFAEAMTEAAVAYFKGKSFDGQTASIVKHFAQLRAIFGKTYREGGGKGGDRKMQSLTSKVLWLRMPKEAPVFDSQAETAIIFLVKLLKATTWGPYKIGDEGTCKAIDSKWGWSRDIDLPQEILDNYWYQDFFYSHSCIYKQCFEKIKAKVDSKNHNWLEPFRYFDKFLWILGNERQDYSLMKKVGESFRKCAGPQLNAHKPYRNKSLA